MNALLSAWKGTGGECFIDREGCFDTWDFHSARVLGARTWCARTPCTGTFSDDWEGSLDVVVADFESTGFYAYVDSLSVLMLNGQTHVSPWFALFRYVRLRTPPCQGGPLGFHQEGG